MAKPATGELRPLAAGGWAARIRLAGQRKTFPLPHCPDRAGAQERCNALAVMAKRLEGVTDAGETERLLDMGAKARPGNGWNAVVAALESLGQRTDRSDHRQARADRRGVLDGVDRRHAAKRFAPCAREAFRGA